MWHIAPTYAGSCLNTQLPAVLLPVEGQKFTPCADGLVGHVIDGLSLLIRFQVLL